MAGVEPSSVRPQIFASCGLEDSTTGTHAASRRRGTLRFRGCQKRASHRISGGSRLENTNSSDGELGYPGPSGRDGIRKGFAELSGAVRGRRLREIGPMEQTATSEFLSSSRVMRSFKTVEISCHKRIVCGAGCRGVGIKIDGGSVDAGRVGRCIRLIGNRPQCLAAESLGHVHHQGLRSRQADGFAGLSGLGRVRRFPALVQIAVLIVFSQVLWLRTFLGTKNARRSTIDGSHLLCVRGWRTRLVWRG